MKLYEMAMTTGAIAIAPISTIAQDTSAKRKKKKKRSSKRGKK